MAAIDAMGDARTSLLLSLPRDVWAGVVWSLTTADVGQAAQCCQFIADEISDPELWLHLFMRTCWPPSTALLAFAEGVSDSPANVDWRARLRSRARAAPVIVVDIGAGYTKFTVAHRVDGRAEGYGPPQIVQLCSSPTHPPDCSRNNQLRFIHGQLDSALTAAVADPKHLLRKVALAFGAAPIAGGICMLQGLQARPELNNTRVRTKSLQTDTGRWDVERVQAPGRRGGFLARCAAGTGERLLVKPENLVPVRSAEDLPLLIGEPFAETANRGGGPIGSSDLARMVQIDLSGRPGPVHLVPQAQMALWAHGVDHGIVVNIGQRQTIALPVINGEVVSTAALTSGLGSASLTVALTNVLAQRYPFIDTDVMTWCRDVKEKYCYVAPPSLFSKSGRSLHARLAVGDDFGIERVEIESPIAGTGLVELAEERVLIPEMFFQPGPGRTPLPRLVVGCAERALASGACDEADVRALLQRVVLVGGAAEFPGIRPRVEFESRQLLREAASPQLRDALLSPENVFVLNPPLGDAGPLTSPRFVPLIGGCVRAASSFCFDAWGSGDGASLQVVPDGTHFNSALQQVPGIAAWMRRRRFDFDGAAVFRTGGGGGEDDTVWERFAQAPSSEEGREDEDDAETEADSDIEGGRRDEEGQIEQVPGQSRFAAPSGVAAEDGASTASTQTFHSAGASGKGTPQHHKGKGFGKRVGKVVGKSSAKGRGKGKGKGQGHGQSQGLPRQQAWGWRPVASAA